MAAFLYRFGRCMFRRRRLVLILWAMVLAGLGAGAATLSGPVSNSVSIPGTESQRALDLLTSRTGANADSATARVVFVAAEGQTLATPSAQEAIQTAVKNVSELPHVRAVADPFVSRAVSPDERTAFATVSYAVKASDLGTAEREALFQAGRSAESAGLTVEFGGDAVTASPEQSATEGIGVIMAALVLLITFGALVAAGLPLLTAIISVGAGMLCIQIASGFFELGSNTSSLALMLGLAVGIDYALFIVSRYRHELIEGHSPEEAAGRAVGTAGSAVVFAGLTVIIALAALSVVGIPFLMQMGLAAAATVLGAVAIAITLLPALLGFAGESVLGRKGRAARAAGGNGAQAAGKVPLGERWARGVLRHRVLAVLGVIITLGVVAIPALDMRLGLPSDATASARTTEHKAYQALADGFGAGFNGPLVIVADLANAEAPQQAAQTIGEDLSKIAGVAVVTPAAFGQGGDTAVITVIPKSGPASVQTEDLVHTIRDDSGDWRSQTGAQVYVTGTTAAGIDVSQKLSDALVPYLAVIVGLAFVLLMLVFRSILIPLKAVGGFLLSVMAAFGAVVAVFQNGFAASILGIDNPGPIISFLPILLVGILFGLAMDYEVFLVTRIREEHVHGATADESIALGFRHGARVVTAAALIMVGVFAGFITATEPVVKSIGFALAIGVFADAFLVRMTLVPALMSLLGNRAYWLPRWFERVLPDLDAEGSNLTKSLDTAPATSAPVSNNDGNDREPAALRH
ncbi:MMPL family transporter [Arthrobacter sp. CDRTa11]|uniref:MMPL family transporter n=1 Tax=Arthrobacter sp. CDRTa11 TaxID=2651199 RepID=UPI0022658469|nr:MMPL family transporter [Arthrobacter sp. CDRTa11]UZX01721.1 MMPL family transporter [Arthrobacter sp. CDRTa11]